MKWFSKKEDDPTPEPEPTSAPEAEVEPEEDAPKVVVIEPNGLYRSLLYDTAIPNTETIAKVLGLPPVSEEIAEMETKESERRTAALLPMLEMIDILARQSANINTVHFGEITDMNELTREQMALNASYYGVALSSIFGALSVLADKGLISLNINGVVHGHRVD